MPNNKRRLTDTFIRARRLPTAGAAYYWDAVVPSFGLRCTAGAKTYILYTRFPAQPRVPVRIALGTPRA